MMFPAHRQMCSLCVCNIVCGGFSACVRRQFDTLLTFLHTLFVQLLQPLHWASYRTHIVGPDLNSAPTSHLFLFCFRAASSGQFRRPESVTYWRETWWYLIDRRKRLSLMTQDHNLPLPPWNRKIYKLSRLALTVLIIDLLFKSLFSSCTNMLNKLSCSLSLWINLCGFWVLVRKKQTFQDIILGSGKFAICVIAASCC